MAKNSQKSEIDTLTIVDTLMNLSQRIDKIEWKVADVEADERKKKEKDKYTRSRVHDYVLVSVVCFVFFIVLFFFFWKYVDNRVGVLEVGFSAASKESVKKDSFNDLKVQIEKLSTQVEDLQKFFGVKSQPNGKPDGKKK